MGKYIETTNARLQLDDLLKNPFHGILKQIDYNTVICSIKPIYFNIPFYAGISIGLILFMLQITKIWAWAIVGVFFLLSLLWTRYLFYYMLKLGLKKAGYKEKIKLLKDSETLDRVLSAWDK